MHVAVETLLATSLPGAGKDVASYVSTTGRLDLL
jgi:hypothetical protein